MQIPNDLMQTLVFGGRSFGGIVLLIVVKILVGPLLLAASTYAIQKWGALVGGLILGLPLISGPVSVLLFMQYGSRFAVEAAHGTLMGFVAAGAFCTAYAAVSARRAWWQALIVAYASFFATAGLLSLVHLDLVWLVVLVLAALAILALTIDAPREVQAVPAPRKRVLAVRMAIAGAMIVALTAAARFLGPQVAGFLAPLPILAAIMAATSHRKSGSEAVHGLLRGTVFGLWGGAAFFSVVVLLAGDVGPVLTYVAALVSAVLTGMLAMLVQSAMPYRLSRQPFTLKALGQISERMHAPHIGRLASHIARP